MAGVSTRRVVVGTAGHVDHGKTSLVRALTGIDCDRWVEEKARGITIDLGFAHLALGDLQIGFVDVPGHERFVHNALAGLGGIQAMILVVAADEGVKPQTREHLAICSLLEIPAGVAVLTKSDLVDGELLELAELELAEALQGTPFEGAPMVAVSTVTGDGLEELRRVLLEVAERAEPAAERNELPTRLPIDRAFHLKGLGVMTTGTLATGRIAVGDALQLLPGTVRARVRSIQVHGTEREEARAGERTSVQLVGADLGQIERGQQLVEPDAYDTTRRILARFRLLADAPQPISGFTPIRFHLYSSERLGKLRPLDRSKLEPGDSGLVEIRLEAPIVSIRGDRFVVRRPSPQNTIGGGTILDPQWQRPRGQRLPRALAELAADDQRAVHHWIERAGEAGAEAAPLARRLGVPGDRMTTRLRAAVAERQLLEAPAGRGHLERWLLPEAYQRVAERARKVVKAYFATNRLALGMPKAEALALILPGAAAELADVYLGWLAEQRVLVVDGERLDLPNRGSGLSSGESELAGRIAAAFEAQGLSPASPREICTQLNAKQQVFDGVVRHLTQSGRLVRLPAGLFLSASALAGLERDLRATGWSEFTVAQFKDRFGLTRKWAIPLLEYLDARRITRRDGERRFITAAPAQS